MSAISTSLASEQRTGRPEQLRGFSIFALVLVFIAVYFGSMFTPPLLDDADSTRDDLLRDWNGPGRVFFFVPAHLRAKVDALLPKRAVLAEVSGKFVYSNQP